MRVALLVFLFLGSHPGVVDTEILSHHGAAILPAEFLGLLFGPWMSRDIPLHQRIEFAWREQPEFSISEPEPVKAGSERPQPEEEILG